MELNDVVELAKELAKTQNGELSFQFFVEIDEELISFIHGVGSDSEKQSVLHAIQLIVAATDCIEYFVMFGAWMSNRRPPNDLRVSDMSDSKEILCVSKHNKLLGTSVIICGFERKNNELVWDDDLIMSPDQVNYYTWLNIWHPYGLVLTDDDSSSS